AGVATGLVDRLIEIELGLRTAARELAQTAQRDAELAHVEDQVGAVVAEAPLLGHLHGGATLGRATDPDSRRMDAAVAAGSPTPRAAPAIAAVVSLGLLGQGLQELAHELVGVQTFECCELFRRQLRKVLRIAQPLEELLRYLVAERPLDSPEHPGEDPVVRVEVGLALHQAGAPEVVEPEQARAMQPLVERGEERLPFLDGDRHPFLSQPVEEVEEHAGLLLVVARSGIGPAPGMAPSTLPVAHQPTHV